MKRNIRDYGLPDSEPTSVPVAKAPPKSYKKEACPNCGCVSIMQIDVKADQELLKGGKGKGTYFGCPACPWASPMIIVALGGGDG